MFDPKTDKKIECYWSQKDGWHFSYNHREMWTCYQFGNKQFVVATKDANGVFSDHRYFYDIDLVMALDCLRSEIN